MSGKDKLKVLLVEDLPSDAELAGRALKAGGLDAESMRVDTKEAFLEALAAYRPDIVISDFSMPAFDGMSALRLAMASDPALPFIILTGSMNEDTAVECMKAGASDYVIKEHITRLPYAVSEALNRRKILVLSAQKSEQLRESEERYRSLFEESHAVMLILDPEEAVVVEANQAACDFYGWPKERLVGMKMTGFNTLGEEEIKENIRNALAGKRHSFAFRHRKADQTIVDVETYSGPIVLGGKPHMFSIIHDVSVRVAAERERDDLSSRLNHYLSTSPTVTYSLRISEGKAPMQWVSENIQDLLGYSVAEALESDWWLRNVYASDRMRALGGISQIAKKGSFSHEYRFNRKDRGIAWIRDEMRFVRSAGGEAEIVGTLTDISERKKVESELSLKSQALEAAANAVAITDRDGTIQWVNPAFERLTGFAPAEAIGKNPRVLVKSGEHGAPFYRKLWDTILSGKVWEGEITNKRKGGERYTEEMTITPVLDDARSVQGFIAIKSDVTERKLARERLEASLAEKEILLREIHHRINNNMQLINSLLSLSSQKLADTSLRELLGGVSQRLLSMALVHEQFYNSPDMARIDFPLYLHQLADGLRGEFKGFSGKLSIASCPEAILFNLEQAIPAGLVAAELIANALKYAYPLHSPPGEVRVSLRRLGATIELSVRDEGVGLAEGFAADKAESLGMILVHSLADQLGGKLEFRSREGTEAVLRFPAE
jgi:PAS domain S-box-containing protein